MKTKLPLLPMLIGFVQLAHASVPFHIYAPSRSTKQLLVVEAKPTEHGLTLTLAQRFDLGFAAGAIVAPPERPLLYVAPPKTQKDGTPGAVVFLDSSGRVDRKTDVVLEHGHAYLGLDRANRFLLGVGYSDGCVDVYPLDESGIPGKAVQSLDEGRRHAHCVLPSPDNRFVYIPYVKESNALYQYAFDPASGRLAPLEPLDAKPPTGTGPRHMAYHPKLPIVYFSNEQHVGVSVYEQAASGQLTIKQVCDAMGPDEPRDGVSASDIVITPAGRYVFAGIRGRSSDFNRVSRYRVKENGELKFLGLTPADEIPWGFALSPDGGYLLVTAFKGETLVAYKIGEDGSLEKTASLAIDKQISDLVAR